MIFKNTFKLLLSNFSLTYKVLFYKLIIFLLALGVSGTIGAPFLMYLAKTNFFSYFIEEISYLFQNINVTNVIVSIKSIILEIVKIFNSLDVNLIFNFVLMAGAFLLIYGFLGNLSELAVVDCLNSKMSSKTKLSFFKNLISKMFKSFAMVIIKFIVSIPYFICLGLLFYYGFKYYDVTIDLTKILVPAVMFLLFNLFTAIHLTIIAGFAPSIIVNDEGVIKGLFKGFSAISKRFLLVLSTSLMITFILTILNIFIAIFSFFAGLILTIPISYLIVNLFKTISFYESNGMRYYVGENIRTPLKKDEQDKIKDLKYIV